MAKRIGGRRSNEIGDADVVSGVFAGLLGGVVLGGILRELGDVDVVAPIVASRGALAGWITLVFVGVLGAVVYYLGVGSIAPLRSLAARPLTGAVLGIAFGMCCWLVAIVAVPVWVTALGLAVSAPYVHWPSLVALLVYGVIVGGLAPLAATCAR